MKNRVKSKVLLSIFVDFLFIVSFLSIVIGAFFISKAILYPSGNGAVELKIQTEEVSREYIGDIRLGDSVYDTLTKREVGKVTEIEIKDRGDSIYFILTLDASFTPRSKALRTENLWFYFKSAE